MFHHTPSRNSRKFHSREHFMLYSMILICTLSPLWLKAEITHIIIIVALGLVLLHDYSLPLPICHLVFQMLSRKILIFQESVIKSQGMWLPSLKKKGGSITAPFGHHLIVRKTVPVGAPFWCHFPKGYCFPIHFLYTLLRFGCQGAPKKCPYCWKRHSFSKMVPKGHCFSTLFSLSTLILFMFLKQDKWQSYLKSSTLSQCIWHSLDPNPLKTSKYVVFIDSWFLLTVCQWLN